jgi:hypothetical protein
MDVVTFIIMKYFALFMITKQSLVCQKQEVLGRKGLMMIMVDDDDDALKYFKSF